MHATTRPWVTPAAFAFLAAFPLVAPREARADPPPVDPGQHFAINPVADGVLTLAGAGFSSLLGLILGTGEIEATAPGPASNLLSIDRGAVTQKFDKSAGPLSDAGLWTALGYAALDPLLSGLRDGWDSGLVDAVMYAESISLTEAFTDFTKIAVRRPRPLAYQNCPAETPSSTTCLHPTDSVLSFWSGHAATVATVSATATYIAFIRAPRSPRPWITLAAGVLLTSFVSLERVRAGEHFPTDVIAGSMAGAAIGVLVPHSHRRQEEAPAVWVGVAPAPGGGSIQLQGAF